MLDGKMPPMHIVIKSSTVVVSCRANTGPVNKKMPVLFEPNESVQLPEGLEVNETLLNIKPGKTSMVQIAVYNGTDHDISLRSRTSLGVLQAVKSVTAADVRLSECRTQNDHQHFEKLNLGDPEVHLFLSSKKKEAKTLYQQLISVAWIMTSGLQLKQC